MPVKAKKRGFDLSMKSFDGKDGRKYLVFRTASGEYHAFVEVEAKQAARECGASTEDHTRRMWAEVWDG